MARLIVADELTRVRFHGYPEIEITPSDVNAEAYKRGWNDAIDAIVESAPTIEAEPRWIPIEQDCPEKGKDVLISHNGVVSIDWLTQSEGVEYFFVSGVAVQDIDAWMPLPEPYREVEE